jgi:hypothetical protein
MEYCGNMRPAKSSRANRLWEQPMQFKNQLPVGSSSRMFATSKDAETTSPVLPVALPGTTRAGQSKASRRRLRSHLEIVDRPEADERLASRGAAIPILSGRAPSWGSILARKLLAGIKAVGGFAARGQAAFASVLLAAMSWTIAQILEGCAEYCQAMYPTFPDEGVDRHDAASGPQSGQSAANPLFSQETQARGTTMTPSHRPRFDPVSLVHAQAVHAQALRPAAKRTISRSWRASITSPVAEFWLRLRHEREMRRAMMALRSLDDPALREVEMSRHRTDRFASPGDYCE